jgi:hypothetical protein
MEQPIFKYLVNTYIRNIITIEINRNLFFPKLLSLLKRHTIHLNHTR